MIEKQSVTCCIAGGGPAGMMLGFLLARAGVEVMVLEKHPDFLRDFRGDTVHPSTLEIMHELGLLDDFLKRPHQEARQITGSIGNTEIVVADFSALPTRCKFVALMPQWDFLDFLAGHGKTYPIFHLKMQSQVTDLLEKDGRVIGLKASTPEGPLEVLADLVVGADGRHSTVREKAGLEVENLGAPIDVLWMRLPRLPTDPDLPVGRFDQGRIFVMLNRGDYWQCAFVIHKDGYDQIKLKGLPFLRDEIAASAPLIKDRIGEIKTWDDVKLLTVSVDRLKTWHRPGLLMIGDAAHAMSPIGGVGINLAIQDAVAAANLLASSLKNHTLTESDLANVQRRRMLPTRVIQRMQVLVQNRVMTRILATRRPLSVPWILKLAQRLPFLRHIPARLIGLGVRMEHVRTPDIFH